MTAAAKKLKQASILSQHRPKTLRVVKNRPRSAEVAFERLYDYLWELGADWAHEIGWKIRVIEDCGLEPHTGYDIINGKRDGVTSDVVDQVVKATGIPVECFYQDGL